MILVSLKNVGMGMFTKSCFTLKADSTIILRISAVFDRLKKTIEGECDMLKVSTIIDKISNLILKGNIMVSEEGTR